MSIYDDVEYDDEGNIIDPCEFHYGGYNGDGMDADLNCLDFLISKNCMYSFGQSNPADEWCGFMCNVRGPCQLVEADENR